MGTKLAVKVLPASMVGECVVSLALRNHYCLPIQKQSVMIENIRGSIDAVTTGIRRTEEGHLRSRFRNREGDQSQGPLPSLAPSLCTPQIEKHTHLLFACLFAGAVQPSLIAHFATTLICH